MEEVTFPHSNAFGKHSEYCGYDVKRVLIDSGRVMDVLFLNALRNMGKFEMGLKRVNFPMMGFGSITIYSVGTTCGKSSPHGNTVASH